jgi:Mn2+/Fe2+ NRAMP family transporter
LDDAFQLSVDGCDAGDLRSIGTDHRRWNSRQFEEHLSRYASYFVVFLLCVANLFNLGADISAMAAAAQLMMHGSATLYTLAFGAISLLLQIFVSYRGYVGYLRGLTWTLFAYVVTAFLVHVPWRTALRSTFVPAISFDAKYLMALVGVLGTTISPYLFFWQTSQGRRPKKQKKFASARMSRH